MKKTLTLCLFVSLLISDDYSFDFDKIEVKSYEYSGYVKSELKYQMINENSPLYSNQDSIKANHNEISFDFDYFKDMYRVESSFVGIYDNIDSHENSEFVVNELFLKIKANDNFSFNFGKKSLKWGKGYFFNPIAFLDRPKDPTQPENAKEGFVMADVRYNKSYVGNLKNMMVNFIYMPTGEDLNSDYHSQNSHNYALKLYLLYFDTDLEFIYLHSNADEDKIGFDFSKNLQTNFEIHGEFAKEENGYHSYLLGLKYLTTTDLTITSEYFYQSNGLNENEMLLLPKTQPFSAQKYFINKFLQKEPYDILYFNVYYKNILNTADKSHLDTVGFTYQFKNNFTTEFSYNQTFGDDSSEFGKKLSDKFLWGKVSWFF